MTISWIVICSHRSKGNRMRPLLLAALLTLVAGSGRAQDLGLHFAEAPRVSAYASGIAVEWKTFDDRGVDYFAVLRRATGVERTVASFEPQPNPDGAAAYRYIDPTPYSDDLAYLLRAVFRDGSFADTEWLSAQRAQHSRLRVLSALDEESVARLHIRLEVARGQEVVIRVKNLRGELLDTYVRSLQAGSNDLEIDYARWPTGYYTVEVADAGASMEWLVDVDAKRHTAKSRMIPRG